MSGTATFLMCAAAAILLGCSTAPPAAPKEAPPPPVIDKPGARLVTVTEANNGANVTLESTQELVVSLPLAPTNGLEWSVVDLAPGVLTPTGARFERDPRNSAIGEANGMSVFHFKPQTAGRVTLTFDLRRPRSLLPAVQTMVYQVTVK